jgi:hypothetical protein
MMILARGVASATKMGQCDALGVMTTSTASPVGGKVMGISLVKNVAIEPYVS